MSEGYKSRKHKSKLIVATDVLQGLLQNSKSGLSDQFLRWRLWQKWGEVVGPSLADHTQPVGIFRGTLYVWVPHPVWIQQMQFLETELRSNINRFAGREWIVKIRFTLDKRQMPDSSPE